MTQSWQNDAVDLLMRNAPQASADEGAQARDFDWTTPCGFEPQALVKLQELADQAAVGIRAALSATCNQDLSLAALPLQQHFEATLRAKPPESMYVAPMTSGGEPAGFVVLRGADAIGWVNSLLGGSSGVGEARELSNLESDLLLDAVSAVLHAISTAMGLGEQSVLRHAGKVMQSYPLPAQESGMEYCELSFGLPDEPTPVLSLMAHSPALLPATGQQPQTLAPQEMRKAMLAHLDWAPVVGSAWIGHAVLPMRDMIALQEGDVLVLDTQITQPVEFVVQGRPVLKAVLALCEGNYALQVVRRMDSPALTPR